MVKEIPQEIDVEKLMNEDVDKMILETDVDDDAQQNESESGAVTNKHGFPPEDVSTVTVEVEQPKIKTVVKCMEDGDLHSHERTVCVPEACDVRIELVPLDGSATVILKVIGGVCCLRNSARRGEDSDAEGTDERVLVLHTMRCGVREEWSRFRGEGQDVTRHRDDACEITSAGEGTDESLNRSSTCHATSDEDRERFSKSHSRLRIHRKCRLSGDKIQK